TFEHSVIDSFTASYLAGRTPNPCAVCNRDVKFDALWEYGSTIGAAAIATGHYARIGAAPGQQLALLAGRDAAEEQSYFLCTLGQDELRRTLFPVGALVKHQVRALARALELPVADKPESQDICFVGGGSYADFVERARAAEIRPGAIVDAAGSVVGR